MLKQEESFSDYDYSSEESTHQDESIVVNHDPVYLFVKRTADIVASTIGMILLSPLFIVTAVCIKAEDPKGKVFYVQLRTGINGTTFSCFKFRSMFSNADEIKETLIAQNEMDGPVFKIRIDPRVTKVGKYIRKTSIDELPQLFNVWLGQMSLVGPRPLPVNEAIAIEGIGKVRELVKPGITCIWQVSGRNNIDFTRWMKLDAEYVSKQSLLFDLKLLLRTIPAVLKHDGAS